MSELVIRIDRSLCDCCGSCITARGGEVLAAVDKKCRTDACGSAKEHETGENNLLQGDSLSGGDLQ